MSVPYREGQADCPALASCLLVCVSVLMLLGAVVWILVHSVRG